MPSLALSFSSEIERPSRYTFLTAVASGQLRRSIRRSLLPEQKSKLRQRLAADVLESRLHPMRFDLLLFIELYQGSVGS